MAIEKKHQVAVRMTPTQHKAALKASGREKVSLGEFIRRSVQERIDTSGGRR